MRINRLFFIAFILAFLVIGVAIAGEEEPCHLDQAYPIDADGTVFLYSDDAEVTIRGTDRKDVHLVIHREITVKGSFKTFEQDPF